MSPQRSNREALLEGALRCLEETSVAKITARQIAAAANANLRSIGYHFGSTEGLIAEAMASGFNRWLDELTAEMGDLSAMHPVQRIQQAAEILGDGIRRRRGLLHAFLAAVANAPHDAKLRSALEAQFQESRAKVALLLGFGDDEAAMDAASLIIANFNGMLVQAALDPEGGFGRAEMLRGIERLTAIARSS